MGLGHALLFFWRETLVPFPAEPSCGLFSPQTVAGSAKGKVPGAAEPGTVSAQGTPQAGRLAAGGRGWGARRLEGYRPPPLSARPCAQVTNGPEGQNYRSELHIFPASPGGPEDAQPAASGAKSARSPSALAPGERSPGSRVQSKGTGACATVGQEETPENV